MAGGGVSSGRSVHVALRHLPYALPAQAASHVQGENTPPLLRPPSLPPSHRVPRDDRYVCFVISAPLISEYFNHGHGTVVSALLRINIILIIRKLRLIVLFTFIRLYENS